MDTHIPQQLYPSDLSRQVAVFPALKRRRQHQSNIWFFDSPKNNERLTITSDLAFMHLVLLEWDATARRYIPKPNSGQPSDVPQGVSVDAHVYRTNGTIEWWNFKRMEVPKGRAQRDQKACDPTIESFAVANGATYRVKTDRELAEKEILFDNWLTLCAAITRCRNVFLGHEAEVFVQRMALQQAVTLENLLTIPDIDVASLTVSQN